MCTAAAYTRVDDVAYDAIALIDQGSSREQAAAALAKNTQAAPT